MCFSKKSRKFRTLRLVLYCRLVDSGGGISVLWQCALYTMLLTGEVTVSLAFIYQLKKEILTWQVIYI